MTNTKSFYSQPDPHDVNTSKADVDNEPLDVNTIGTIRKTVIPMFDSLLEKINDKINVETETNIDLSKLENTLEKFLHELKQQLGKDIKLNISDLEKLEKVKEFSFDYNKLAKAVISNLPKQEKTQKVEGTVKVAEVRSLQKSIDNLIDLLATKSEADITFPYEKGENIPVSIREYTQHEIAGKGGASEFREKQWLREEYTYTTVSGCNVVSQIKKWDSDQVLTERYEYDGNANAIVKSRSLELHNGIGV
jgi:hypothetical protein